MLQEFLVPQRGAPSGRRAGGAVAGVGGGGVQLRAGLHCQRDGRESGDGPKRPGACMVGRRREMGLARNEQAPGSESSSQILSIKFSLGY